MKKKYIYICFKCQFKLKKTIYDKKEHENKNQKIERHFLIELSTQIGFFFIKKHRFYLFHYNNNIKYLKFVYTSHTFNEKKFIPISSL